MLLQVLICMSRMRMPLTQGEGIALVNSMIKDTPYETELINWKRKQKVDQPENELGTVGVSYWYGFLKRHKKELVSKKGKKFALDRSNWTKYMNFKAMYDDIEEEMIDAGVSSKLDEPVWMNEEAVVVEREIDSYGMKITY